MLISDELLEVLADEFVDKQLQNLNINLLQFMQNPEHYRFLHQQLQHLNHTKPLEALL